MPGMRFRARLLRALGPTMGPVAPVEGLRAAGGGALGLALAAVLLAPHADLRLALAMIAPFGATAVLVFAVPNSPLAQPWSAVMGNTVSALVAVAVVRVVPEPVLAAALACGLAILAMALARALHPPGGAVALTVALNPDAIQAVGFRFVLAPVAVGTAALVLIAVAYARATGRRYPFRQPEAANPHGIADRPPSERLGLGADELRALLDEFRQSANVGVEDLARLIAGAEQRAAAQRLHGLTVAGIMSRDLVTVLPETPRAEVAAIFTERGFTSLPVVTREGEYHGLIFQIHLIRGDGDGSVPAAALMTTDLPGVSLGTPLGDLLPLLADGAVDAVPVLRAEMIVGIVTRTDLVAALARRLALETGGDLPSIPPQAAPDDRRGLTPPGPGA